MRIFFNFELSNIVNDQKMCRLLQKLGTFEHSRYVILILLKNPRDFTLTEMTNTLSQIFGEQLSLFNMHYQCFKLVKNLNVDLVTVWTHKMLKFMTWWMTNQNPLFLFVASNYVNILRSKHGSSNRWNRTDISLCRQWLQNVNTWSIWNIIWK